MPLMMQYQERQKNTKNHPSIELIKTNNENNVSFCFQEIQAIEKELKNLDCSKASQDSYIPTKIEKELKNFDCSKASQDSYIPTKTIKDDIDIFVPVLLTEFNESLK